jgi:2-keto-3-deoxy-L-rhamnonate aldolase RhmA
MKGSELRQALAGGERVYGIALEGYGQPRWQKYFARLGLDFVFMDNEHTPLNRETAAWAAQAYAAHGIAPLFRIPETAASLAAMGVDMGAHGIVAPYVENAAQVKAIVGAVKHRPLKGVALQAALDEGIFPNDETQAYLSDFNSDAVVVIMIESPAGVANLPALLSVEGVDAVLIGPHDLSVSHGIPEDYDHPLFEKTVQHIFETCNRHGVAGGIHFIADEMERARRWIEWGSRLVLYRSDTSFVARGINKELQALKLSPPEAPTAQPEIGSAGHGH